MKIKKLITGFFILMLSISCFAQSDLTQNETLVRRMNDPFYVFKYGDTQSAAYKTWEDIKHDTTLRSAIYYIMPYLTVTLTIADANTPDSIKTVVKLYSSNHRDTTKMVLVKNLRWIPEYGPNASQDTLDATGEWGCNFNESEFRSDEYFMIILETCLGHRKIEDGVDFTFKANGVKL